MSHVNVELGPQQDETLHQKHQFSGKGTPTPGTHTGREVVLEGSQDSLVCRCEPVHGKGLLREKGGSGGEVVVVRW